MLTGDDGQGNPTSTTTNNNKVLRNEFVDNGDGLELTRGAAFNLVADNAVSIDDRPIRSRRKASRFSAATTTSCPETDSRDIRTACRSTGAIATTSSRTPSRGNTFGLNLTGVGNIVDSNVITANRIGIVVRPADPSPIVRLTRNRISGNGRDIRRCEAGGSCDPTRRQRARSSSVCRDSNTRASLARAGRGVTPNPATMQHICPEHAPQCQAAPNRAL